MSHFPVSVQGNPLKKAAVRGRLQKSYMAFYLSNSNSVSHSLICCRMHFSAGELGLNPFEEKNWVVELQIHQHQ